MVDRLKKLILKLETFRYKRKFWKKLVRLDKLRVSKLKTEGQSKRAFEVQILRRTVTPNSEDLIIIASEQAIAFGAMPYRRMVSCEEMMRCEIG